MIKIVCCSKIFHGRNSLYDFYFADTPYGQDCLINLVEYAITEYGESLKPILDTLVHWGKITLNI
ncbi:winged helix-turn-helix transcriptional regulator [Paenibacillus sp. 1-18]|uniref:winged helix-turn-helix transcriptional regulator n=1 Tax=Paenibacillus sp. 1-18 TaxID=1333846 RepID=UPI0012DCB998